MARPVQRGGPGVTGGDDPSDFLDARTELDGIGVATERIVERVDPRWVAAVAAVRDDQRAPSPGRWITLLEEELGPLPREEKPWIRDLAGRVVALRAGPAAGAGRDLRLGVLGCPAARPRRPVGQPLAR